MGGRYSASGMGSRGPCCLSETVLLTVDLSCSALRGGAEVALCCGCPTDTGLERRDWVEGGGGEPSGVCDLLNVGWALAERVGAGNAPGICSEMLPSRNGFSAGSAIGVVQR